MAQSKSWKLGEAEVTVSLPDAVADRVRQAWDDARAEALAARGGRRRAKGNRQGLGERLSADRIVEVAIEQMREQGYDAVTMRSIARALGTGPASLYAHVASRAELDQLVVDRVCAQLEIAPPDPERWDEQLRQVLRDLLALYRDHPGVARATLGMIPVGPGVLLVTERLLALLRAGRVPDQYSAWALDVLSLVVASVAVEEDMWRQRARDTAEMSEEAVVAQVRATFERLPAEHFPLVTSMAEVLTTGGGDERFEFAVTLLVEGLKAVSARPA
jgi:AcrR family transcriptional regulator